MEYPGQHSRECVGSVSRKLLSRSAKPLPSHLQRHHDEGMSLHQLAVIRMVAHEFIQLHEESSAVVEEASPFLLLPEREGIESLAEYFVFLRHKERATLTLLVPMLTQSLRTAATQGFPTFALRLYLMSGLSNASWRHLLDGTAQQLSVSLRSQLWPDELIASTVSKAIRQDEEVRAVLGQATVITRQEAEVRMAAYLFLMAWIVERRRTGSPGAASQLMESAFHQFYSTARDQEELTRLAKELNATFEGLLRTFCSGGSSAVDRAWGQLQAPVGEVGSRYHMQFQDELTRMQLRHSRKHEESSEN